MCVNSALPAWCLLSPFQTSNALQISPNGVDSYPFFLASASVLNSQYKYDIHLFFSKKKEHPTSDHSALNLRHIILCGSSYVFGNHHGSCGRIISRRNHGRRKRKNWPRNTCKSKSIWNFSDKFEGKSGLSREKFLMSCYRFLVLQMPSRTSLLARGDCIVTKCPVSLPWGVKGLNHA